MLEMTADEMGAFLEQQETGVLSTCADGEAYGTPESFGYRNGKLYFELATPAESKRRAFLTQTDTVCFTVQNANTARDFASVIVQGSLDQLSEDGQEAQMALAQNDQFPSSHVFPGQDTSTVRAFVLDPESVSGKKGPDFEIDATMASLPVRGDNE
jgi:nitroimidazol reductase NimA-like FMN-containing flavoprotein (pyridoxamine 5'-phosphate oxidase superfamily)